MSPEIRAMLEAARDDGPSLADRHRIRLALAARLAGPIPPPDPASSVAPHATSGVGAGGASAATLALGFTGIAAIVGIAGFLLLMTRSPREPEVDLSTEQGAVTPVIVAPSSANAAPLVTAAPPALEEPPSAVPSVPAASPLQSASPLASPSAARPLAGSRGRARPVAPRPQSSVGLAEEVAALQRARNAAKAGDPDRAIAVLDELERRQPGGALGEERRASRIIALCASSRADEGHAEAQRFAREMPSSIHVERVRAACTK